ncbi:diguanylate cyclase response regulator [Steroidobacter agaridevorans]|uniref:Diguanylate cyclase response regulator n=1 Tax=Steroidobacter agaridevorans TaxID=2695856 RepID=A0A829Y623_9GAMM|nr:response regulator [Steroidobacter agaridevorans]GFE78425.1 diguanylate cyclase response regulator [Steroidobacter agaridevorans]GFE89643.1 diguanylate cyclase response regulator [Steroidobacter agaridevorans]
MSASPDFSPPRRVLIVDADVGMRESAAALLKLQGFEVAAAADGVEALTMFAREWFPVVITDSAVPAVDDIEFIARLRILSLAPVYVIMLTEIADVRFQERGYCMGVDQYLMRQNALVEIVGRVQAGVVAIRRRQSSKTGRAHEPATVDLENGAHTARHLVGRLRAEIVQAGRSKKPLQLLSVGLDAADVAAFNQHTTTGTISDTLLSAAHDAMRPKLDWVVRLPAPVNTCRLVVVMPESGPIEAGAMEQTIRNAFVHWGLSSAASGIRLSTGLAAFAGDEDAPAALELLGQAERSRRTNDMMSRSSAARSESVPAQDAA